MQLKYSNTKVDPSINQTFRFVYDEDGNCIGRLYDGATEETLEASPGIQQWSHPRGKVATKLADGGASIANFSAYWERHYGRTYPFHSKAGE